MLGTGFLIVRIDFSLLLLSSATDVHFNLKWISSEIDDVETGLLIEVWDKGMLWDKAIGYFWTPLQSLQFSAVVSKI